MIDIIAPKTLPDGRGSGAERNCVIAPKTLPHGRGSVYALPVSAPPAYFLTWHTYGTWLHGDEQGSVDPRTNIVGDPFIATNEARRRSEQSRLQHPPVRLDSADRTIVQNTILEVAAHRRWRVLALHVRTTHVHVVVSADAKAERVLNDFKSYATRRLREAGRIAIDTKLWSRHGSTRYVWNDSQVLSKIDYVVNAQGTSLDPLPFIADEYRR